MTPDSWIDIVSRLGFPMAIAAYFILKIEKLIKQNNELLAQLIIIIQKCTRR